MLDNIMTLTDGYKPSHWRQYPPNTTRIYSYLESRGGLFNYTVFFGLQYNLMKNLVGSVVTTEKLRQANRIINGLLGQGVFNRDLWHHIIVKHAGNLPLQIRAVPEGTIRPSHAPLMTVENTCAACYWLPGYLEGLLVHVWYPTTVATLSRACKTIISDHLYKSGDPAELPWKLHDFGFRGTSSVESSAIGGAAHLVNFRGSDTVPAIEFIEEYYSEEKPADSIVATEHSTITTWGQEHELEAYRNILAKYPDRMVACVSDSYDIRRAVSDMWGGVLHDEVMARQKPLVIRPDSGDPVASVLDVVRRLDVAFGSEKNHKGYRILDPHVRVIQGDGVDMEAIDAVLTALEDDGYSASNVAFGMGGALLQKLNRDTLKFALKCSWAEVDGEGRNVFKRPVDDPWKMSQPGRFDYANLPVVFDNGRLFNEQTFSAIRERAAL